MGIAGMTLCIAGLVLTFYLFTPLAVLLFLGLTVACIATGLTLSGVAFYQAREEYGEPTGISIVGLGSGVAAIIIFIVWVAYTISTPWPT